MHPGAIVTDLMRFMPEDEQREAVEAARSTLKSVEQGAATTIWCATSAQLDGMGGVYCEDVDIAEAVSGDSLSPTGVRPWATDPAFADRLWTMSDAWMG